MEILILGGTGAMGVPLVNLLSKKEDAKVYVTTRSKKENYGNITYLQGNAKNSVFFNSLMTKEYDVIIDFMVYTTEELKNRLEILLNKTKQYFFFSSSRCYADSKERIRENSPRLVDICEEPEYLALDEYGMAKGREENLLKSAGKSNWTIIRPYITYNAYRIQLGVYEKEDWLKRALKGKTIIFPKDIADKKTSLTYGPDVAGAIVDLIGNEKAYGEAFHITTEESHTWREILYFYCDVIEKKTGKRPKVKIVDNSYNLQKVWNKWQIKYDRLYNREFDNSKIESIRGHYEYKDTFKGLEECLNEFLEHPIWSPSMNVKYEAYCDRITGERTPLRDIPGKKAKLIYLMQRYL